MLGKLEKADLKTIWKNEAYNFMPWLAQKENLELLGYLIGIGGLRKKLPQNLDFKTLSSQFGLKKYSILN